MKRCLFVTIVMAFSCGRGAGPAFVDFEQPGETRVTGELRTPDDRVPRAGRIMLRDAAGQTFGSAIADEVGRFSVSVDTTGAMSWVAVDDDGHAARGSWALQPHGANALGRLWLSAPTAAPWLVSEKGFGFEERLTDLTGGISPSFELSGDRAWVVAQNQLNGVHVISGDVRVQAAGLPWSAYWKGLVSPGRYLSPVPSISDRRADAPSCGVLLVQLDVRTLSVWDPARELELARFEFPNNGVFLDSTTRDGLVFFGCDQRRATLIRYVKTANDGRELSVERYEEGRAQHVASLALDPTERVLDRNAEAVLLFRVDGNTRTMRLWWPAENRQLAVPNFNFISAGLDATGRTLWRDVSTDTSIVDLATGESTSLGDADLRPSANREWLLAFRRKGELRPAGENSSAYFTTGLELTRVNLATRVVERLPSLPPQVERALAKGLANFNGLMPTLLDDGTVLVLVQTDEGSWVCDLLAGTVSRFAPEQARSQQSFELVRAGEHLVIIERLTEPGTTDWAETATLHVGRPGQTLRRRTFLSTTTGAVRVTRSHVVFARRDPLTGVMQLSRLALDVP